MSGSKVKNGVTAQCTAQAVVAAMPNLSSNDLLTIRAPVVIHLSFNRFEFTKAFYTVMRKGKGEGEWARPFCNEWLLAGAYQSG
jgi:hypothetical protein